MSFDAGAVSLASSEASARAISISDIAHWNVSEWRKDPDTGKRQRVMRPRSEWITRTDESQRIVSDQLWRRAQRRMNPAKDDKRLRRPAAARSTCCRASCAATSAAANYTIQDSRAYGCHAHFDGNACSNDVRVTKAHIEDVLLRGPETGLAALLAPDRVERMAAQMQRYYQERVRAMQTRATEVPRELQELTARLERLRERLRKGDPADELQVAIDRAEEKRSELKQQQPEAKASAKVLSILPRAAKMFRRQVQQGLEGEPPAALKARVFLRDWFGGKIRMEPLPHGGLMAHWNEHATTLLRGCERVVAGA